MRRMKIVYSLTAGGLKKLVVIASKEDAPRKEPATAGNPFKTSQLDASRNGGATSAIVENHEQLDALQ